MNCNTFIYDEVTMLVRCRNMDDGTQFFYQPDLLYGVKPNDENDGIEDSNDKNMGGEDTDLQAQPSYPDFSSYFMTDEVYFITFICMWFAIE